MMIQDEDIYSKEEQPSRNILLVDDEENIIRALMRLLRQDDYKIFTANSGKDGLEILKTNNISVIVSDQRMPEMSGTEFLSQVSQLYPDTIRIVLSGYTDLKSITGAINEGKIYKFLTKPWDEKLLRKNIEDAFNQYELEGLNKRLSIKLKKANEELQRANLKLENNVQTETRNAEINLRSLQVAQDILSNLPVGILGADNDKTVVFANNLSHNLLAGVENGLIGNNLHNVLSFNADEYNNCMEMNKVYCFHIEKIKKISNIIFYKYRILDDTDGFIVVLVPFIEGCND